MVRLILPKDNLSLHTAEKLLLSLPVGIFQNPQNPVTLIIRQVEVGPPILALRNLVQFTLMFDRSA